MYVYKKYNKKEKDSDIENKLAVTNKRKVEGAIQE